MKRFNTKLFIKIFFKELISGLARGFPKFISGLAGALIGGLIGGFIQGVLSFIINLITTLFKYYVSDRKSFRPALIIEIPTPGQLLKSLSIFAAAGLVCGVLIGRLDLPIIGLVVLVVCSLLVTQNRVLRQQAVWCYYLRMSALWVACGFGCLAVTQDSYILYDMKIITTWGGIISTAVGAMLVKVHHINSTSMVRSQINSTTVATVKP